MNYFKRARTSLVRNPGKSLTLLFIVFLIGALMSGAISVRHAVGNTEAELINRLPAVASVQIDIDAFRENAQNGEDWRNTSPTADDFRKIGALPYIRGFDFVTLFSFMSQDIQPYRSGATTTSHTGAEWVTLTGVHNPNINDIDAGLIQLVAGRVFDAGETHVMIVSESFAQTNGLTVGSYFELAYIQVNYNEVNGLFDWPTMLVENYYSSLTHTVQVVGIFEVVGDLGVGSDFSEADAMEQLLNRIYLPTILVEEFLEFQREQYLEVVGSLSDLPEESFLDPLFLLDNAHDLVAFAEEADAILPEFWYITDLSSNFAHLRHSMENIVWIANVVLQMTVGASVIVLGLLVILFLHDRKHEIGIYLALGENRGRVLKQLLVEVLLVAVVAISLAVFTGNMLSERFSRQLMEQSLNEQAHAQLMDGGGDSVPVSMQMFDTGNMTVDEMMAAYDTSLGVGAVILLFAVGMGSVVVSVMIPMSYVLRLNPKKVLM